MTPEAEAPVLVTVSVDPKTSHRTNEAVRIALIISTSSLKATVGAHARRSRALAASPTSTSTSAGRTKA